MYILQCRSAGYTKMKCNLEAHPVNVLTLHNGSCPMANDPAN